jgi:pyruvate ferredoxin oxidoreductase gamma subunit
VPNVPLLGAFAALCGLISLEAVQAAIEQKFSGAVARGNVQAAQAAYASVQRNAQAVESAYA